MLIDETLFGKIDKVEIALKRLKEFEPSEGYWLAFGGGKDSITIYELAKMAGVKFDPHYNLTGVDPPELVHFIRRFYPDVKRDLPEKTMWQLIVMKMMPPTRLVRYCCEWLKERSGEGRVITGVRWAESLRRKKTRRLFEHCYKDRRKFYLNPIIDWSTEEVWEFIRMRDLPYPSLYDQGEKRIGCILCPMGGRESMERDKERYPKIYQAYLRAFGRMLEARKRHGIQTTTWTSPESVAHWWIYESHKMKEGQIKMIFE